MLPSVELVVIQCFRCQGPLELFYFWGKKCTSYQDRLAIGTKRGAGDGRGGLGRGQGTTIVGVENRMNYPAKLVPGVRVISSWALICRVAIIWLVPYYDARKTMHLC